jgi:hypothetical protein
MRRASTALLAAALIPAAAAAQTSRGWELCFTSGVLSCTTIELTTTPQLVGGARTGTLFDVVLRYTERDAWPSALQAVSLSFAPATDVVVHPTVGATPVFLGGCGVAASGGVIDATTSTPLWTCAPSDAYRATFLSAAVVDADGVATISLDAYRAYPGDGPPLAPFCTAQTDGSGSLGTATGDFMDFGDVCAVRASGPSTAVPEPSTALLVAAGLLVVPALRRRPAGGASA